ncbi:hypothetical protein CBL_13821 [Carabus blaptoides fortunei]
MVTDMYGVPTVYHIEYLIRALINLTDLKTITLHKHIVTNYWANDLSLPANITVRSVIISCRRFGKAMIRCENPNRLYNGMNDKENQLDCYFHSKSRLKRGVGNHQNHTFRICLCSEMRNGRGNGTDADDLTIRQTT